MKEEGRSNVTHNIITKLDRKGGGRSGGARRKIVIGARQKKTKYMGSTESMSFTVWNCQEFRSALTISYLSDLGSRKKLEIIFLIETKNNEGYCETVRRKFKMDKGCYVEPNGLSGGLALCEGRRST